MLSFGEPLETHLNTQTQTYVKDESNSSCVALCLEKYKKETLANLHFLELKFNNGVFSKRFLHAKKRVEQKLATSLHLGAFVQRKVTGQGQGVRLHDCFHTSRSSSQISGPDTRHSQSSLALFHTRYRLASWRKKARKRRWLSRY